MIQGMGPADMGGDPEGVDPLFGAAGPDGPPPGDMVIQPGHGW